MSAIVLVAGAAGGVGEGIVRALLAESDVGLVVASSRSEERLALLRERLGRAGAGDRLVTFAGDAGSPDGAEALAERIAHDVGPLDVAIPSLGGWWEGGPFLDVDAATWERVMHEMLGTHVVFARTFIPVLLRAGGRYLAIGGGAGIRPIRNASIVSIAAAAQIMLTRALAAELDAAERLVIEELVVDGPVRTRESASLARPGWITAEEVGAVTASLALGREPAWERLHRDGPLVIMRPRRRARD